MAFRTPPGEGDLCAHRLIFNSIKLRAVTSAFCLRYAIALRRDTEEQADVAHSRRKLVERFGRSLILDSAVRRWRLASATRNHGHHPREVQLDTYTIRLTFN